MFVSAGRRVGLIAVSSGGLVVAAVPAEASGTSVMSAAAIAVTRLVRPIRRSRLVDDAAGSAPPRSSSPGKLVAYTTIKRIAGIESWAPAAVKAPWVRRPRADGAGGRRG
ncbi:hypothetical protein GCM10027176_67250 [Actinoallomurus bryophytorum]